MVRGTKHSQGLKQRGGSSAQVGCKTLAGSTVLISGEMRQHYPHHSSTLRRTQTMRRFKVFMQNAPLPYSNVFRMNPWALSQPGTKHVVNSKRRVRLSM